jgi:hypothetical protein
MRLLSLFFGCGLLMLGAGCTFAEAPSPKPTSDIRSYEECVQAGFKTTRMMPPQCITNDGKIFIKGVADGETKGKRLCRDLCGDGACASIVCMAEGCPCPENPITCPQDCRQEK